MNEADTEEIQTDEFADTIVTMNPILSTSGDLEEQFRFVDLAGLFGGILLLVGIALVWF